MSKSFAIIHNHHLLLPEMITCKGAFPVKLFLVIYRQYRLYLKRPSRRRIRARAHVRWILMSLSVSFPLLGCLSISKAHDHCPMPLLTLKEYITITPHLLLPRYWEVKWSRAKQSRAAEVIMIVSAEWSVIIEPPMIGIAKVGTPINHSLCTAYT